MIELNALSKRYRSATALYPTDLSIGRGEVFGLLGPNGSGKSTTVRLLLGLIRATSGGATVAGLDPWRESLEVRRRVSYLPGELRLPGALTGRGMLRFLTRLRGPGGDLDRVFAIADRLQGVDLDRKVRDYSTGMKQKLALAQVFADPVEVLILDEPTSALDPSTRAVVIDLIREAKRDGRTVIFSGHVLPEVEEVADRVAIMRRGRLMRVEDLHSRRNGVRLLLLRFVGGIPPDLPSHLGLSVRERRGEDVLLLEHRGEVGPLLTWLSVSNILDLAIGTDDLKTLYDVYHGPNAVEDPDASPP